MYTSHFISVSMTLLTISVMVVSFLVKTISVVAQVPGIIPPPLVGMPGVLSQPADDSQIIAPQTQSLPGTSGLSPMTEIQTFTTENTVRPNTSGQPSVIYVYLYPGWMSPNLPLGMTPPLLPPPSVGPSGVPSALPVTMPPAPPGMLPPVMFPPYPPLPMWGTASVGMTPPVTTGCFGKNGRNGPRLGHPSFPPAMEYPNPALLAADPYHATRFTPSVVAPPMVVYPNGVMIKPKVYLPGKFCHNVFQAVTP